MKAGRIELRDDGREKPFVAARKCDKVWNDLGQTASPDERFCRDCRRTVYLVTTTEQLMAAVARGECVSASSSVTRFIQTSGGEKAPCVVEKTYTHSYAMPERFLGRVDLARESPKRASRRKPEKTLEDLAREDAEWEDQEG